MIDLVKAKKVFKSYVERYDIEDDKIELKIKHTYGVVKMSEYIATRLDLDDENIKLAELIALLHDIGRFEQVKKFDRFIDIEDEDDDHAKFGVDVLFENNLIRSFIKEKQYDNIILKAIKNHNKYQIEAGLNKEELLHSQIIRDADKIDNIKIKQITEFETLFDKTDEQVSKEKISDKVYSDFFEYKLIKCEDRQTSIDCWASYIAWIFDFNFPIGLKYLRENKIIDQMIDRIDYKDPETRQKMKEIKKCANEYLAKMK